MNLLYHKPLHKQCFETNMFFMFISFERFALRVVIIGDKNYPKARFRVVFSSI